MEEIVIAGLSQEEYSQLLDLLSKVQQPWTHQLYSAFAKVICFTAVEVVIFRWHGESLQVLLTGRKPGEYYAGQTHSPGSVVREDDAKQNSSDYSSYSEAIIRVLHEVGLEATDDNWRSYFNQEPVCVPGFLYKTPRGTESCVMVLAELNQEPRNGHYVDVEEALCSDEVITHNKLVIERAAWAFEHALPQLRNIHGW